MAKLEEVSERFALDMIFSERPVDTTIERVGVMIGTVDYDAEFVVWHPFEEMTNNQIMQLLYDQQWAFEQYYKEVG